MFCRACLSDFACQVEALPYVGVMAGAPTGNTSLVPMGEFAAACVHVHVTSPSLSQLTACCKATVHVRPLISVRYALERLCHRRVIVLSTAAAATASVCAR